MGRRVIKIKDEDLEDDRTGSGFRRLKKPIFIEADEAFELSIENITEDQPVMCVMGYVLEDKEEEEEEGEK